MRPNHQTTCERDPACWEIERVFLADDLAPRRYFIARCVPTGRVLAGYYLGSGLAIVSDGHLACEGKDRKGVCSCRAWRVDGECRHLAIFVALSRFLAKEAEKESTEAEERRERCAKEIEGFR